MTGLVQRIPLAVREHRSGVRFEGHGSIEIPDRNMLSGSPLLLLELRPERFDDFSATRLLQCGEIDRYRRLETFEFIVSAIQHGLRNHVWLYVFFIY